MTIVTGHLIVRAEERDAYLAGCRVVVEAGRTARGCLDFALSPDLVDASRINILERWESRAAVEAFRGGGVGEDQSTMIVSGSVIECDVSDVRVLW